jgi:hypothetical protein
MHGLTGGSWKRNKDRTRATEMKDTRGNPAVTSGSETYRRSSSPRQLSTLLRVRSVGAGPAECGEMPLNADKNRCACPGDVNRFIARSRCLVG